MATKRNGKDFRAMALHTLEVPETDRSTPAEVEEPHQAEVLRQLRSIASSTLFSKSKRYPSFLRYIVEHTLAGRTDLLKERTLGIEVFSRPNDYDTNADPVVRITAGEIRKRLAQYYQMPGHEGELRIDLPIGSYTPHFSRGSQEVLSVPPAAAARFERGLEPDPVDHAALVELSSLLETEPTASETRQDAPVPKERSRSRALWVAITASLVMFGMSMTVLALRPTWENAREGGIASFWNSVFHAEGTALIVVGVHSFGSNGKDLSPATHASVGENESMLSSMTSADMIPLSDVVSYGQITNLLTRREHGYKTQSAAETTFGQLQPGPVILLGGLDNFWTMRLTSSLRFRFAGQSCSDGQIQDAQHPGTAWHFDTAQSAKSNSRDYAIAASFFDPQIEQRVLIAAGIGKSGTAAAANFLTNNRYLQSWMAQTHTPRGANVELVLSTEIVQGQQGPPHVVAWSTW